MNMFKSTTAKTPAEYIAQFSKEDQNELTTLDKLIRKTLPTEKPVIISGMIGYGLYPYKSKSGRSGEWPLIALARQKNYFSVYVCALYEDNYLAEKYQKTLGKVNVGKSCIRFKKVEDLNFKTFEDILILAQKLGGMNKVG